MAVFHKKWSNFNGRNGFSPFSMKHKEWHDQFCPLVLHIRTSSPFNFFKSEHLWGKSSTIITRIRAARKGISDVFPQSWGFTMSWWYPQMDGWFHGQSQAAQWMTGDTPISGNLQQAQQRSHQSLRSWREQIFLWVSSEFWHQNSYGCLNASAMITKVFGPRHAMFGRDACRRCIH